MVAETFREWIETNSFDRAIAIETDRINTQSNFLFAESIISDLRWDLESIAVNSRDCSEEDFKDGFYHTDILEWMIAKAFEKGGFDFDLDEDGNEIDVEWDSRDGDAPQGLVKLLARVKEMFGVSIDTKDIESVNITYDTSFNPDNHGSHVGVLLSCDTRCPELDEMVEAHTKGLLDQLNARSAWEWANYSDDNHILLAAIFRDVTGYFELRSCSSSIYFEIGKLKIRFADHKNQSGNHDSADWNCGSFAGAESLCDALEAVFEYLGAEDEDEEDEDEEDENKPA
jgi:hypothetical protein